MDPERTAINCPFGLKTTAFRSLENSSNISSRFSPVAESISSSVFRDDVTIINLEDDPRADDLLANIDEIRVEIEVEADRNVKGYIEEICQVTAEEALADCNVKAVIDEGPVLFIKGTRMSIAGHLYTGCPNQKGDGITINRLWRKAMTVGNLTNNMLKNRKLTGTPKVNMRKFYSALQEKFLLAQTSKKKDKE